MNNRMQSESISELGKALVKAQAMMSPAIKDARNPFLNTRYASLNAVLEACREPLLTNGLAIVQSPAPAPEYLGSNFIGLETKLLHAESGQWIASLAVIPLVKPDPQAMGAAISYARRYSLSAMLGIVSEEDNDCEIRKPEHNVRTEQRNDWIREKQKQQMVEPPALPGVNYKVQQGNDGREYIIATGKTRENRDILKQAGFSWNPQQAVWYRAA